MKNRISCSTLPSNTSFVNSINSINLSFYWKILLTTVRGALVRGLASHTHANSYINCARLNLAQSLLIPNYCFLLACATTQLFFLTLLQRRPWASNQAHLRPWQHLNKYAEFHLLWVGHKSLFL